MKNEMRKEIIEYMEEITDNKRYFIGVMIPAKSFVEELDVRVTEIRYDNYLDYILEKEGMNDHGKRM